MTPFPKLPRGEVALRSLVYLGLKKKFLLGLAVILVFVCFLCAWLYYRSVHADLVDNAFAASEVVMTAVEANRSYVRELLRPRMYELVGADGFVLEAMSTSYISRAVMDRFQEKLPSYDYRRVAINARNPKSEANDRERAMIEYFIERPDLRNWQGIVRFSGRSHFMRYKPVYFSAPCLHCHGDPAVAPEELIRIYGPKRGFGHQSGELAAVMSVGVPVDVALSRTKNLAFYVFGLGLAASTLLFVMISLFFNRVVVHSLRGVLDIFRSELGQEGGAEPDEEATLDEVDELAAAARTMAERLRISTNQLEENARDLETKVRERTADLKRSQLRLTDQVAARNRELRALNAIAELTTTANHLPELFPRVIHETLGLVPAGGAGLYLLGGEPARLVLKCQENSPALEREAPAELADQAMKASDGGRSLTFENRWPDRLAVPLRCRGDVLGLIVFTDLNQDRITPELEELLVSIGRQVGVAVESLTNLQRQIQTSDLLQSAFDGFTDEIALLGTDYRIKMVNRAYLEAYGVAFGEIADQTCHQVHTGGAHPCEHCRIGQVIETGRPLIEEITTPTGEAVQIQFYPILDESGRVESILRYAKSVTDQKRIERQIRQTDRLVSVGQLAAGLAHEINNPLGVILCYTDLLRRQMADFPQGLNDLSIIEKHTKTCQRIMSDLLNFARSGETAPRPADIGQTIAEAAAMIEPQYKRRHVALELDLAPDLPPTPHDVDKMKQVFLNLFINAGQAVPSKGRVRVSAGLADSGDMVEIVIRDNGAGIDQEVISRVFDPFFSTKPTGQGTGLGLSVSYGIIKDHRGEIRAASEPGQWTEFVITLPLNPAV